MRRLASILGVILTTTLPACRGGSGSSIATQVAVGHGHACAVFTDGTARCWGVAVANGQRGAGVMLDALPFDWTSLEALRPRPGMLGLSTPNRVINLTDAVALAAGAAHTCARRKDGTVWCWGVNKGGQLGVPPDTTWSGSIPYPVRAEGIAGVTQLTAGDAHTCARRSNGSVWCFGENGRRQLGRPLGSDTPIPVQGVSSVAEVRAGGDVTCVRHEDGTVRCWGNNGHGQTGDGKVGSIPVFAKPFTIDRKDVTAMAIGEHHTCARTKAGTWSCWGSKSDGQLQVPKDIALRSVVAAPDNTYGLASNGDFWCWGKGDLVWHLLPKEDPERWRNVQKKIASIPGSEQLAVGKKGACVRLASGAVKCWGASFRDTKTELRREAQGPFDVRGLETATDLAAGDEEICAVTRDGSVQCWSSLQQLNRLGGISDAVQLCHGDQHGCVRHEDGRVSCWGVGDDGQLGRGRTERDKVQPPAPVPGLRDVEQVAASSKATCARRTNGSVHCWGDNRRGQVGKGVFSSVGPHSVIDHPVPVDLSHAAVDLWGGGSTFCARLSTGSIACWGDNGSGEIVPRQEGLDDRPPTLVSDVREAVQLAVGRYHACVRTNDAKVLCWGGNEHGQMGDGTVGPGNRRLRPVEVAPLEGASELFVSSNATCGRLAGGRVGCVGAGSNIVWWIPGVEAAKQIAMEVPPGPGGPELGNQPEHFSGCAVMTNGALACWGNLVPRRLDDHTPVGPPVQVRW